MKYTNRLSTEKSPYLLQHAHNPVDWYAWTEEAFQKARLENKPIILSIGYSTCHWCHVMEKESFEDEATAQIMNRDFVSIKVDREERQDIDSLYMSFVTAMTGSGGWPMTVFMTPDQKPFYGGTYFPPEDRHGMPGFKTLLSSISEAWKTRRDEILRSAESSTAYLRNQAAQMMVADDKVLLSEETLEDVFHYYESTHDAVYGGFGRAPKFPRPHALASLLRFHLRSSSKQSLQLVTTTLNAMMQGGIYDQLGGGFHRYSTDAQWRIPHFEKMLYDQALLVSVYVEAFQATGDESYARVIRKTLDYVLREMTSLEGGFYSAQDADSADPALGGQKKEGAYFVWSRSEIEAVLSTEEARQAIIYYGIKDEGNAIQDPHNEFLGKNVLYQTRSPEGISEPLLKTIQKKLLTARELRPKPHLDDKILTDWNALMIVAFSAASRALNEPRYLIAAERAAAFIHSKLLDSKSQLLHRYRDGQAAITAGLNDYAFLLEAMLELYQATSTESYFLRAKELCAAMIDLFWDEAAGGFYLISKDAEVLIARPKELYDGAVPAANSMAVLSLLKLSRLTGESRYRELAERLLAAVAKVVSDGPANYTQMLIALDFYLGPSYEIVIAGDVKDPLNQELRRSIDTLFIPNKIVAWVDSKSLAPELVRGRGLVGGKSAVYVCRNFSCQLPVTDPERLRSMFG